MGKYNIIKDTYLLLLLNKCEWALKNGSTDYQHYRFKELVGYLNHQLDKQKYREKQRR